MQTTITKRQKYDIITESRSAQPLIRFVADEQLCCWWHAKRKKKEEKASFTFKFKIQGVPRRESTRNAWMTFGGCWFDEAWSTTNWRTKNVRGDGDLVGGYEVSVRGWRWTSNVSLTFSLRMMNVYIFIGRWTSADRRLCCDNLIPETVFWLQRQTSYRCCCVTQGHVQKT